MNKYLFNCIFCKELTKPAIVLEEFRYLECPPCKAEFCILDPNQLIYANFTFKYKSKSYAIWIHFNLLTCELEYYHDREVKTIAEWNFIPDFTPQNIKEKMPTLLTFS